MSEINPLVIFRDNDTGCDVGFIHTSTEVPTIEQIAAALSIDEDDNEVLTGFRAVTDFVFEGRVGIAVVKYNSNGWAASPLLPQIGTITIHLRHSRPETPGTIFGI